MKLKRFALKGLVILAVAVALCMFFARTVLTITTPKVQIVQASRGKLEQKVRLSGQVYFPETTDHILTDAAKSSIVIDKVYVRPGHHVKAGETLFTATLATFDKDWKDLEDKYNEKAKSLMDKDIENRNAARESNQNDLYDAVMEKQTALAHAEHAARVLAADAGVTLGPDISKWPEEAAANQNLAQAAGEAAAAKAAYDKAYSDFFLTFASRKTRVSSSTFKFINERNGLLKELSAIQDDMVALSRRKEALSTVTAPHDGYVVTMDVKSGDTYEGKKSAFTLSDEAVPPVLRAEITSFGKAVADGTKVEVKGENSSQKTSVAKTQLEGDGKKYIYVTLTDGVASAKGGITQMVTDGSVDMTLIYRSKESATLIPASAVRSQGEGQDYVYLIQQDWGGFLSGSSMKVVKTSVTVLDRGDTMVAVREEMEYQQIADREDRALTDGCAVMEYID